MHSILGNLPPENFLSDYWQKKPLLVRNALTDFPANLTPDELAGLSLEEDIRSRIVLENDGVTPWECRYGPFSEQIFSQLPKTHWTLLVQDIEKILPDFTALLDYFHFLPRWRIDDLMVSYAAPGGSVGPHLDQYDVFLLQGMGKRQWQIQQSNIHSNELLNDTDLQILKDFDAEDEWEVEPGDMLYLPPGVAHYGIAIDECITYSIGFRTPSLSELIQNLAETTMNNPEINAHYRDRFQHPPAHRGEIHQHTLEHIRCFMAEILNDKELTYSSICSLLTETSVYLPESPKAASGSDFKTMLRNCKRLEIHPATRMLYRKYTDVLEWFIDGKPIAVSAPYIHTIALLVDTYQLDQDAIKLIAQDDTLLQALHDLYNNGGLILHE